MNIDELTNAELDRRLAELLEPEPTCMPDIYYVLMAQLDLNRIYSPKGAWDCLCEYYGGDEPRWVPRQFSSDWAMTSFLIKQMQKRELYVHLYNITSEYRCLFSRRPFDLLEDLARVACSNSLVKAVARAACKALEKRAQTEVEA